MIDCHAHICHSIFDRDREKVIKRAQAAGVKIIIAVSENINDSRLVPKICQKYPGTLLPCMGIHPDAFAEDRKAPSDADIVEIMTLIRDNRHYLVGIGEVGLDYRVVKSDERRLMPFFSV